MYRKTIEIEGKRFVIVEESEFNRLERRARRRPGVDDLPSLPGADAEGNRPARAFIRASIARDIIRERRALGLTQEQLARLAGIRQETLSRIESAKHSPNVRTVQKIERALQKAAGRRKH
jgi:DNA-binding XRE family transcriptional regulator